MLQRTLAKAVEMVGIGLHKGVPVKLRLEPLPINSGIVFYREDKGVSIPATWEYVVDTTMATVIGKEGVTISTIEHLLSAINGSGIDNIRIVLDNDEVPIMDGSAITFCMILDEAGIVTQSEPQRIIRIKETIEVIEGDKFVRLLPADKNHYEFEIVFNHPAIGGQKLSFAFSRQGYRDEIARARTFGFLKEVQYLRSIGLALGGNLDNAIVLDDKKILNEEGLRYEDEFVRHKILDAIGDMALLGIPFLGRYEAYAGSHKLNHLLTKRLLESPECFEVVSVEHVVHHEYEYSLA